MLIPFATGVEASCILAEDTVIPANVDTYALVYVHAEIISSAIIWVDDDSGAITDEQKITALASLRSKGIYISEA